MAGFFRPIHQSYSSVLGNRQQALLIRLLPSPLEISSRGVWMQKPKIFYGWYMVGACLLIIILDGLLLYSFGVFLPFMAEEFAVSRAELAAIFSIRSIVLAVSLVLAGRMIDKYDPRIVILTGGLIAAVGLIASGLSRNIWELYLTFGVLIGLGDGVLYIVPVAVISRWFNKKRALAIGIITTGVPISGFFIPPLTEWLITTLGVREAMYYLAAIMVVVLMAVFVLRSTPESKNLKPYGENGNGDGSEKTSPSPIAEDWTAMEAFKTSAFWRLYLMFGLGMVTFLVVVLHFFSFALDSGISSRVAAFALACVGIGSLLGRVFLSGVLIEILKSKWVLVICYFFQGSSILIAIFTQQVWGFYLFGILFGIFHSGWVPIIPHMLASFYGVRAVGTIYGLLGTSFSVAAIIGPLISGWIYKNTGSYADAFALAIIFCYTATFVSIFISPPKKRKGQNLSADS